MKKIKFSLMMDDDFIFESKATDSQIEILEQLADYIDSLGLCAHVNFEVEEPKLEDITNKLDELVEVNFLDFKDNLPFHYQFKDGSDIEVNGFRQILLFRNSEGVDYSTKDIQYFEKEFNKIVEERLGEF